MELNLNILLQVKFFSDMNVIFQYILANVALI